MQIHPNGQVPAIVDTANDNFAVFETSAILLYLAQHFDKENIFTWDPVKHPKEYSELLQWLFFAVNVHTSSYLTR